MASMPSAAGKNYGEILRMFTDTHSSGQVSVQDLERIHIKWKKIAAECK
jgi:hypothetical protein